MTRSARVAIAAIVTVALASLLMARSAPAGPSGGAGLAPGVRDSALPGLHRERVELARRELAARGRHRAWMPIGMSSTLELVSADHSFTLDFTNQQVSAVAKLTIRNGGTTGSIDRLFVALDRFPGAPLTVTGPSGPLAYVDLGYGEVKITLGPWLQPGQTMDLTISQTGEPACSPIILGIIPCQFSPALTCMIGAQWTPLPFDETAGSYIDAAQGTMQVTVPAGFKVAAAALDDAVITNLDGTTTYRFKLFSGPDFCAAPFQTGSTPFVGKAQVRSFVLADNAGGAQAWREVAVDILNFHAQRYGPYDLPKLDIIEEHPLAGAAFGPLSGIYFPPDILAGPTDWWSRSTMAHELGHQWFGGFIDNADPFSPWLAEGFASFAEMEYTIAGGSKVHGFDYGPTYRQFNLLHYIVTVAGDTDAPLSGPKIWSVPDDVYIAITYYKGAMVPSMLRSLLGDPQFRAAMARFRQDHVNTGCTVSSLAASVKSATGQDVTAFLDAWAKQPGYPVFTVEVQRSRDSDQFITRVNAVASTAPQLPVQLDLELADGTTRREVLPFLATTRQSASFTTAAEVLSVRLDPDSQVVGRVVGALPGDVRVDGDVDGADLVELGWALGTKYDPWTSEGLFPVWADLVFDGAVDQKDLDVLLHSFGKRSGEGG